MKVWRFYKIPEKSELKQEYQIYAITSNKKYAKEFKERRNMDKFLCKTVDFDKEEWKEFASDYRGAVLDKYNLTTIDDSKNMIGTKSVKVLMTEFEYQSCNSDEVIFSIFSREFMEVKINFNIFNEKLQNALIELEYNGMKKLNDMAGFQFLPEITNTSYDYSMPDILVDELGMFIRIFENTFK